MELENESECYEKLRSLYAEELAQALESDIEARSDWSNLGYVRLQQESSERHGRNSHQSELSASLLKVEAPKRELHTRSKEDKTALVAEIPSASNGRTSTLVTQSASSHDHMLSSKIHHESTEATTQLVGSSIDANGICRLEEELEQLRHYKKYHEATLEALHTQLWQLEMEEAVGPFSEVEELAMRRSSELRTQAVQSESDTCVSDHIVEVD